METMQTWFGLKEEHNDFAIETDVDARLFFARNDIGETLNSILKRSFRTGNPPKMVLYGDWGVGKTHTMRHIEYVIDNNDDFPAKIVFRELPDIAKKSTFQVAHSALLDALGFDVAKEWMVKFFTNHASEDPKQLIQDYSQSGDIAIAFVSLIGHGDTSRTAWDWLRGVNLKASELKNAGLGPILAQSNEFVSVLQMFGRLCNEAQNEMLIFMLDEATKLGYVQDQDAIYHWTNALKCIADQQTKEIGFIVSISCTDPDEMALPLLDEQVRTRFSKDNYIMLTTLGEAETKAFISCLLAEWIDDTKRATLMSTHASDADGEAISPASFPFTDEGFDFAVAYACSDGGITRPRDIQQTLDNLFNRAIDDDRHILSSEYLHSQINM
jgi:hypothetical protein